MSDLWATLTGGAIALAGSLGSTIFVQSRVPVTEQRHRAQQAADELINDLARLELMPSEPDSEAKEKYKRWHEEHDELLVRIKSQALLLPAAELRERIEFIVYALGDPWAIEHYSRKNERWLRSQLCRDIVKCIGAFLRGEKRLPPPSSMMEVARKAMKSFEDELEMNYPD